MNIVQTRKIIEFRGEYTKCLRECADYLDSENVRVESLEIKPTPGIYEEFTLVLVTLDRK